MQDVPTLRATCHTRSGVLDRVAPPIFHQILFSMLITPYPRFASRLVKPFVLGIFARYYNFITILLYFTMGNYDACAVNFSEYEKWKRFYFDFDTNARIFIPLRVFLIYSVFMNFQVGEMEESFSEIFSWILTSESVKKRGGNRTKFSLSECQQVANRENWRESRARNSVVQFCTACLVYSILCFVQGHDDILDIREDWRFSLKWNAGVGLSEVVRQRKKHCKKKGKKIFETLRINLSSRSIQSSNWHELNFERKIGARLALRIISLNKFH